MSATARRLAPDLHRLFIGALLIVALAPYARTLAFGYVMDDTTAIRSNPDFTGWGSLLRVWTHPYGGEASPYFGLYRPLTMAVFAFIWNAGGHWALWFHVLAISMHAGATLLVWRLLERGVGPAAAVLGALWFAVHPVHVEAVANIANSSEVLVAIWTCLLAVYLARVDRAATPPTWVDASVTGALYLAAFLSKESGAVAPILATLWVWGCRPDASHANSSLRAQTARWWRVIVAWSVAVAIVIVARAFVLGGPVTGEPIAAAGLSELSAAERLRAMLALGPSILRLLFWPSGLNPHYGPTTFAGGAARWLALSTLAVLALGLVAGIRHAQRGDRRLLVALAWIVVAFLPASNILVATGQILAERTLYVPSIGVALLVALVFDELWLRGHSTAWRAARTAGAGLLGVLIGVAMSRSARWTDAWKDHDSLFARMIAADPAGYRGYWLSGLEARRNGQIDDAIGFLGRAYALYPRDRGLMIDYAQALLHGGQAARAATVGASLMSSSKMRSRPYAVAIYLDALGAAFGPDSVIAAGRRLNRETPSATTALFVGRALELRGDTAAAADTYREGLRVAPGDTALQLRLNVLRIAR